MAKPELGTKRVCPSCGTKYYDLHRNPITCPSCGTVFEVVAHQKTPERVAPPPPVAKAEPEVEVERDEAVVSLEEVEEDAEADIGPDADEEDAVAAEGDVASGPREADDTFLEEEEEEGDVSGLLDVETPDEDER